MARRQRLDAELVRRQLVESRTDAGRAIAAGRVLVNGSIADKASRQVHAGDAVVIAGPPARFVSRGGEKLDAALGAFAIDVTDLRVLDAGASTGGFTDCLLQRGAGHVVALDVGHGQLHPRIREDARVTVYERFHIRDATPEAIGGVVQLVTADLSFISLRRVLAPLIGAVLPGGALVLLVKPQFEAGKVEVARAHGVITDVAIHERVRDEVGTALIEAGCEVRSWIDSPIYGGDGNREFLVHATTKKSGLLA
ncbi:MAG: TlyA family RNA methyltransferase [Ilumatobacteraceae bacterium]|nr:TlyA family RNA methyltransferase [Ilumatobacteraceae bacterium]